jgi:hypothetical protein
MINIMLSSSLQGFPKAPKPKVNSQSVTSSASTSSHPAQLQETAFRSHRRTSSQARSHTTEVRERLLQIYFLERRNHW